MRNDPPRHDRADTFFRAAGGMALGFGLTVQALYWGDASWQPGLLDPGLLFIAAGAMGLAAGALCAVPLLFRPTAPRWIFRIFLLIGVLLAVAARISDHLRGLE